MQYAGVPLIRSWISPWTGKNAGKISETSFFLRSLRDRATDTFNCWIITILICRVSFAALLPLLLLSHLGSQVEVRKRFGHIHFLRINRMDIFKCFSAYLLLSTVGRELCAKEGLLCLCRKQEAISCSNCTAPALVPQNYVGEMYAKYIFLRKRSGLGRNRATVQCSTV